VKSYTCPYCNRAATLTVYSQDSKDIFINIASVNLEYGDRVALRYQAIVCPNEDCKKLNLTISLNKTDNIAPYQVIEEEDSIETWRLLPESFAKPMPNYLPKGVAEDYKEARRIQSLSPKASATLARRALQGMIRDFFGIKKRTLYEEITELQGKIPGSEWNAIDALRKIGNIGAHMEKDVNIIIDIEEDEADKLLAFIEYLVESWYIKRHDDDERLASIVEIAGLKKNTGKAAPS
jgi:hypothetical protein